MKHSSFVCRFLSNVITMILWKVQLIFRIASIFFAKKKLEKKDLQIIELLKTINELRDKDKDPNKREAFRIDVPDEDCTFEFLDFDDKGLEVLKNRTGTGRIKDISAKGLKLVCDYDLPLKNKL